MFFWRGWDHTSTGAFSLRLFAFGAFLTSLSLVWFSRGGPCATIIILLHVLSDGRRAQIVKGEERRRGNDYFPAQKVPIVWMNGNMENNNTEKELNFNTQKWRAEVIQYAELPSNSADFRAPLLPVWTYKISFWALVIKLLLNFLNINNKEYWGHFVPTHASPKALMCARLY